MSNSCLNTSGKLGPLLPATCSNSVAYVQQAFKHLLEYKFAVLYLRFGYGALKLLAKSGDLLFELPARYNNPEKDAKRLAQKRKEMTDEERLTEQTNKRKYNANYYLKHREAILAKQQRKRTSRYIAKHGERAFWLRYSHREVAFQK
ncbi:hypothetical protein GGU11DRAFT_741364 [Lentinula aff. detonsa]|nr:hypothetical protein GGU11DRAFT_741364 [Lentinula aff. detonsa]